MPDKSNTCRRCEAPKDAKYFYPQRRNTSGLEGICKDCKRVVYAAKRFNVPETLVTYLYTYTDCMCCGADFKDRRLAHIHHTEKQGVRGIVCFSCNYILSEEKKQDRERIEKCLDFMARENLLYTVNQQERPNGIEAATESSETTRCENLLCKQCGRSDLEEGDFYRLRSRKPRRICKSCSRKNQSLTASFKALRLSKTQCECCGSKFTKANKSCVHHIGDTVHGVICNRCNQVLGDESDNRRKQLLACLDFMI